MTNQAVAAELARDIEVTEAHLERTAKALETSTMPTTTAILQASIAEGFMTLRRLRRELGALNAPAKNDTKGSSK